MSNYYLTAVWKCQRLKGSQLLVMLSLADQANDEGECWPSVRSLSQRCRCDAQTINRAISALKAGGYLDVEARFDPANGRQKSNVYQLYIDALSSNLPGGQIEGGEGGNPEGGEGYQNVLPIEPSLGTTREKPHSLASSDALLSEPVSQELALPGVPTILGAHMEGVGLHMGNPDLEAAHKRGLARGSAEQRKERADRKATDAERRRWFDAWLSVYPRPELAEDAWREFRTLGSQITPDLMDAMTAGLEAWIRSEQWQKEDGRFIPGAAKFIRNRLWENPPRPARHVMELPDA